jgi:AraC family transcriptional regulator, transcriptional activator of pobA
MPGANVLPLFHLLGDPPDDKAFDFIHVEPLVSRSSAHNWRIPAHRHRDLFQIFLVERGGGEITYEASILPIEAPAALLIPPTTAHGFRWRADVTDGWVVSFTDDVAEALGSSAAMARLKTLAETPIIPLSDEAVAKRIATLCAELHEEHFLAREGYRLAMRGLLALIAINVARLAASRARTGSVTLAPADATVEALRKLVEDNFRKERHLEFYATRLSMTADRLNDHVKRATGVTAGHLIRQRVLTEAKRQLVFTNQPIHEIAYDLAFSDPSHFARFFRKQTGTTPHEFREGRS